MDEINNEGALSRSSYFELESKLGQKVGISEWFDVDQAMIDQFATLTHDHFFIHVDPERAKRDTPLNSTIAHGFLSLSMLSAMSYSCVPGIMNAHFGLNYGFNRLRFVSPVPVNSRIRGHFSLKEIDKKDTGEITIVYDVFVELENQEKPVVVAEWITKAYVKPEATQIN
jgi:acyl dehydratase